MADTHVGLTKQLVQYAATLRYEDIPDDVIRRTKEMFLDFLGVGFGGLQVAESSGPIIDGVNQLASGSEGGSTVIGRDQSMPAHYAALLNATFAHSMDFDDTHRDSVIHVGTPLFATLLALAEEHESVSGRDFIAAAVAGYDVTGKVGRSHGGAVHARGFHPTATTGIFGATMAGGRLIGLGQTEILNAVGLNISQSAGSLQFLSNGAWNKRFHVGLTAHNAVLALTMARCGYFGSADALEGSNGYFRLYAGEDSDQSKATAGLGKQFEVLETALKPYPCCRYSHATIDAMVDFVSNDGLDVESVEAIEIEMGTTGFGLVAAPAETKREPLSVVDGQFSVYFAVAASVLRGRYDWGSYDLLADPTARELMRRTNVVHAPERGAELGALVTVRTRDGRSLQRNVELPKGEPENPMSWEEISAKFLEWASPVLGHERAKTLVERVSNLDQEKSVKELGRALKAV